MPYTVYSPYYKTSITGNGYLGIWVPRNIPSSKSDQLITISATYNNRPDLLAYDLYGNSMLWWVFSMRNPNSLASDPLGNFVSGLQIYVPSSDTVKSVLGV